MQEDKSEEKFYRIIYTKKDFLDYENSVLSTVAFKKNLPGVSVDYKNNRTQEEVFIAAYNRSRNGKDGICAFAMIKKETCQFNELENCQPAAIIHKPNCKNKYHYVIFKRYENDDDYEDLCDSQFDYLRNKAEVIKIR